MNIKKMCYTSLLVIMLCLTISCKNNSSSNSSISENPKEISPTPEPTPMPTANITITTSKDGTPLYWNEDTGLQIEFDSDTFDTKNEIGTDYFLPKDTDKKASKDTNLFLSVFYMENITAEDMASELTSQNEKEYKKTSVTLGKEAYETTKISVTDQTSTNLRHEYYLLEISGKLCLLELKCPKKYEKNYGDRKSVV